MRFLTIVIPIFGAVDLWAANKRCPLQLSSLSDRPPMEIESIQVPKSSVAIHLPTYPWFLPIETSGGHASILEGFLVGREIITELGANPNYSGAHSYEEIGLRAGVLTLPLWRYNLAYLISNFSSPTTLNHQTLTRDLVVMLLFIERFGPRPVGWTTRLTRLGEDRSSPC